MLRLAITEVTVRPDAGVLELQIEKFPALGMGNFTCEMVAGARYEPVQIELGPLERFVARVRRVA